MRTIRMKIIVAIVICSVLTAGIVGAFSILNTRGSEQATSVEQMRLQGSLKAQELNATIVGVEQSVNTLSDLVLAGFDAAQFKRDKSYADVYTQELWNIMENFAVHTEGTITSYIRYNPDYSNPTSGIFLTRNSTDEPFDSVTPTDFSIYDPSDAAHVGWYYIPVENGAPIWMDPYLNENIQVYMISYVVPLFAEDGTSIGIVGMDIDFGQITELVDSTSLFDSGYAFLTGADGSIMYHRDIEMGQKLSELDSSLAGTTELLADAGREGSNYVYSYQGVQKQLSCYHLRNGMRLVTAVPQKEIYAASSRTQMMIFLAGIFAILISGVVGVLLGNGVSKPILHLTEVIAQTTRLDFSPTKSGANLRRLKDEVGTMAREIHNMRKTLREMVGSIDEAEMTLLKNVDDLNVLMKENSSRSEDNSAATQELAAGMQLASTNASNIVEGIQEVRKNSSLISQLARDGKADSREVSRRANDMEQMCKASSDKTNGIYEVMRQKTDEAIEQSRAVERINELTDAIKQISSQTNLLALNASIEAARAGDAGRGFAVVATEIGDLAGQTLHTVENINSIVGEVNQAVANMTECISGLMKFLEETVLPDYESFQESGGQYQEDANSFIRVMDQVDSAVSELDSYISSISSAVEDISGMVSESSDGIDVIAQKSTETAQTTQESYERLQDSRNSVDALKGIVERFQF
ncbi:MAG: methyl-accepting chemotaxis protein [Blautia sp.]|nr:methyl-accepting chemotaxis protein [Blautia sp.]